MQINRFVKYFKVAITPAFWTTLMRGVAPAVEHIVAIQRLAPATLIDVGANKGQFATMARRLFPNLEIHAIEPLESERSILTTVVSEPVRIYATAVGATKGEATFFVASRADSSSLFRPGAGQESAYGVVCASSITVPVSRICDIINIRELPKPILMKLDVQGGELNALKGAEEALRYVDHIYCETSFVQLYDDQPLANDLASYLMDQGFVMAGVYNQSVTKEFGATQADFLWTRRA